MGTLNGVSIIKSAGTTPPVVQNNAGVEVGQMCTAWVKFSGATGAIYASFNVSSVTRNSIGNYTINFSTVMSNTSYVPATSSRQLSDGNENAYNARLSRVLPPTLNSCSIVYGYFNGTNIYADTCDLFVSFFGGK